MLASAVSVVAAQSPGQRTAVALLAVLALGAPVVGLRLRLLRPAPRQRRPTSTRSLVLTVVPMMAGIVAADLVAGSHGGLLVKMGPLFDAVLVMVVVLRLRPSSSQE